MSRGPMTYAFLENESFASSTFKISSAHGPSVPVQSSSLCHARKTSKGNNKEEIDTNLNMNMNTNKYYELEHKYGRAHDIDASCLG